MPRAVDLLLCTLVLTALAIACHSHAPHRAGAVISGRASSGLDERSVAACPNPAALHAARIATVQGYMARVNGNLSQYIDACDRYYTANSSFILRGIGSYSGQSVVTEYGLLLFVGIDGVRTVGMSQAPDNATFSWATSAEGAAAGDVNDTVTFKVNYVFNVDQDPVTGEWAVTVGGLRNTETLRFGLCSDSVLVDYSVGDPDILPLYLSDHIQTPEYTCTNIMAWCVGDNQAYATYDECVAFFTALQGEASTRTACPYALSSNTTACRDYHTDNAYVDPAVHCPHTLPDSMVCVDECNGVEDPCPLHAHYTVYYASISVDAAVYSCQCDDGYYATSDPSTGALVCLPASCSENWQCDSGSPTSLCDTASGLCSCQPTFSWNATTRSCSCDAEGGNVYWDLPADSPVAAPACIPLGRCLAHDHCLAQTWNTVQCTETNPPDILSEFLSCVCNAGFEGGFDYPCSCPHGEAGIVWSSIIDGEVCIGPGQCAADYNCEWESECVFTTDPTTGVVNPIGTCSA